MITKHASDAEYFVRGLCIPTKFFFAPINTGYAYEGLPDARLLQFHRDRSGKKIGISYVGNVAISSVYKSNDATAVLGSDLSRWRELAAVIKGGGSVPGIQLACKLPTIVLPSRRWRSRDVLAYVQGVREKVTSLSTDELDSIFEEFVRSARVAVDVGFSVVQLHAAHGYLLSELFSRTLNLRTDRFASSTAIAMLIKSVRAACPNVVLDIRLSLKEGLECFDPSELQHRRSQILKVASTDVDIVSLSAGLYEVDRFMIYPEAASGSGVYVDAVRSLAEQKKDVLWNVAGNVREIVGARGAVPQNLTFSVGRPLIADPYFIEKSLHGERGQITQCIYSGHCHYYTRGQSHISCKVNPNV